VAAKNRLRELDDSIEESTWVGTSPGGDKFYEMRFSNGGMFSGNFFGGMSLFASGQNKLEGSWSQSGNAIRVLLSGRLKGQEFKAIRTGNLMKGSWGSLTYSFEVTRVLSKPVELSEQDEAAPCNLRGIKITVFYREKGGVNLSGQAARVADKLRGKGAELEVQKGNSKDFSEKVVYYNGQNQIATRISECLSDTALVSPFDGGVSYTLPNVFQIYLQTPAPGTAAKK